MVVSAIVVGMILVSGMGASAMAFQRDHGVMVSAKGTSFALEKGRSRRRRSLADGRLSGLAITDRCTVQRC
jgi:hypothetical protein